MPKFLRPILVATSVVVIAAVTVFVIQGIITDHLDSASDVDGEAVSFTIETNETIGSISDRLHDDGLIRSPAYFRFRVRFSGQDQDIVAGQYDLNTTMTTSPRRPSP